MDLCRWVSKFGIAIVNSLFWLVGCGLIFMGAFMFAKYANYGVSIVSMGTALLPALILLVVGILAILLGIIGCCSAFKDQKCGTALFFTVLLFIFVGLLTGTVLSFVYSKEIGRNAETWMQKGLDDYLDKKDIQADVDWIQMQFKCCGVHNYTDWTKTPWYKNHSVSHEKYPESCCVNKNCTYNEHDVNLFNTGCYTELKSLFHRHLIEIAAVGAGFELILVLGMIFSCVLLISKRRSAHEVPYIGIPDPDGLRI